MPDRQPITSFEKYGSSLGSNGELGGMHISEVAALLGMTRARVQQVEMRAVRRLWNEPIRSRLQSPKPPKPPKPARIPPPEFCIMPDCSGKPRAKGLCMHHYDQTRSAQQGARAKERRMACKSSEMLELSKRGS